MTCSYALTKEEAEPRNTNVFYDIIHHDSGTSSIYLRPFKEQVLRLFTSVAIPQCRKSQASKSTNVFESKYTLLKVKVLIMPNGPFQKNIVIIDAVMCSCSW